MKAFIGASIGVVVAAEPDCRYTDLLRKADVALYKAKSEGRGCYRMFSRGDGRAAQAAQPDRVGAARRRSPRIAAWRSTTSPSTPTPARR